MEGHRRQKEFLRSAISIAIGVVALALAIPLAVNVSIYWLGEQYRSQPFAVLHWGDGVPIFMPDSLHQLLMLRGPMVVWRTLAWAFSASALPLFALVYALSRKLIPEEEQQTGDHGSAAWANLIDARAAGLLSGRGVVVGALRSRRKVRLLRYDGEGHIIVVSPTRSGKGVTIVVPTALTWEHSMLFNDIKGELWALTAGWRKKHFNSVCLRFDATCEDGSAARWNPLFEIRPYPHDVRDAQNIALTLCGSESASSRSDNERHWRVMGARLVKAVILHQLYVGNEKTLPGCYSLLTSPSRDLEDTLLLMLRARHDPELSLGWKDTETGRPTPTHPAIAHIARDMLSKAEREQTAIVSSAVSHLEPFDDPIMAANVSASDFQLTDLMQHERPVSLYLTTPVADLERVQSLHRLFFTLAGTRNTEHLEFRDGEPKAGYKHRLLQVFDECAHLGYSPVIQKQFSLASGYGIQGMFVFQDFSQLFDLYGRNESITSNCDVKVAFAPNNIETAEYLSRILGTETREKITNAVFPKARRSEPKSHGRALLTPDECMRLDPQKSIVIKNGTRPILGHKVPYFEMPELLKRTKVVATSTDRIERTDRPWWETLRKSTVQRKEGLVSSVINKPVSSKPNRKKAGVTANRKQMDLFASIESDSNKDGSDGK